MQMRAEVYNPARQVALLYSASCTFSLSPEFRDLKTLRPRTCPKGKLYMLQTRTGKRTAHAALQIAVDMANEGLISKSQAWESRGCKVRR